MVWLEGTFNITIVPSSALSRDTLCYTRLLRDQLSLVLNASRYRDVCNLKQKRKSICFGRGGHRKNILKCQKAEVGK